MEGFCIHFHPFKKNRQTLNNEKFYNVLLSPSNRFFHSTPPTEFYRNVVYFFCFKFHMDHFVTVSKSKMFVDRHSKMFIFLVITRL